MPMPESSMVKVEFVLSGMILMKKLGWAYETQISCALFWPKTVEKQSHVSTTARPSSTNQRIFGKAVETHPWK
jgi:hypothetical protein